MTAVATMPRDHVAQRAAAKRLECEDRHERRADAHRIERPFQRQAGARGLAGGQPAHLQRVEGDVAGNDRDEQRADGIDDAPRTRRQHVDEEGDAEIFAPRERARRAEEAGADHQAAGDVVGPLDRGVEQEAGQHRDADHDEVGGEQDRGDRIADGDQRRRDPTGAAALRDCGD
jgi:hypothetical protein